MKLKWTDISKYRNELCGLAIISIIIFHYFERAYNLPAVLKPIDHIYRRGIGSIGVDLFLFLSGYGIAYSLSRNQNLLSFYKKRFERVGVPYMVMGGIYWIVRHFVLWPAGIKRFLYDYSLLSFWTQGQKAFWYIALIVVLYLISPFIFKKGKRGIIAAWICSVLLGFAVFFFWKGMFKNTEIALLRIPVYFMGMYCGILSLEGKEISPAFYLFSVICFITKLIPFLYKGPFNRLTNAGYILLISILYVIFREKLFRKESITIFNKAGKYSLELYILHAGIRSILTIIKYDLSNPFIYALMILIVIPLAVFFSRLDNFLCGN